MEAIIKHWMNHPNLDPHLKQELQQLDSKALQDAFYTDVAFGTAGMRGLLGVGTNRLNVHTIRKANVAFAKYLLQYKEATQTGVAIAYDNRYMSVEFAQESARVLAMYNIPSFVFKSLRPTPELSFAVRHLNCVGGIVITASHNPKEYNGYKVYDQEGCQLIPELIEQVIAESNKIEYALAIKVTLTPEQEKLIHVVDDSVDLAYYQRVEAIKLRKDIDYKNIKLVFSPQHGTAHEGINYLYKKMGVPFVEVLEQADPDPAFSNTKTPNPEESAAYELAIAYALKEKADAAICTDPDADRLGVVVKHNNDYVLLTGNQTGSILIDYVLSTKKELNTLPHNPVIFNTVVTSDLGEKVANNYGVEVEKTLTGFKFIGDKIKKYQETKERNFVFGYEESYGYLVEPFVRDKDALQACVLIAEAISYYKAQGKTLVNVLNDLYEKYGYHLEEQMSITLKGEEGSAKIKAILEHFREADIESFAGIKINAKEDYQLSVRIDGKNKSDLAFPKSDVIKYFLSDGTWVAIRPSGTEPKMKFYFCVLGKNEEDAKNKYSALTQDIKNHIA